MIPGVEIKPGACVIGLQAVMVRGCITIGTVYAAMGYRCTLTSGVDGQHSPRSRHYLGLAADFRTRDILVGTRTALRDAIASRLGQDFDVILESDHLHVEWDPKP